MNSTMRTASTSRSWAVAVAAVALLALATGCGTGTDDSGEPARPAEPVSHPTQDRSISAGVGERFTLTVEENASTREHWYLGDPGPDTSVVRSRGEKSASDSGDEPVPGAGSDLTFTFEATGKGSTEIVLMHCTFATTCEGDDTGTPSSTPTPTGPERVTYTVTVS
ncbi:protease inhibitor I42 family protein [Streptomyces sp. V4I2]|uniref:protease inhibitor I42 family protein n=1 Tax=Streptomyces sp. V4I2 TaxID=3042280 RepID=UPI00278977F4|nr:protease inhibitor I42 family protein [Streptomyces sp. V4I2]MDQ1046421.1 inhibitor of cysteine peptidase [Streptomyces sp. V4I2]